MLLLFTMLACSVPTQPVCGDFMRLDKAERVWDYDVAGRDEELFNSEPWDAGEDAAGFTVVWDVYRAPDAPESSEDPDNTGEQWLMTWQLSCLEDGTVLVHDVVAAGEDWERDVDPTPWTLSESYEPPVTIWKSATERGTGWTGTTSTTCSATGRFGDGDCSESRDWDIVVDDPGPVTVGPVTFDRVGLSGTVFPWAPFERMKVIPLETLWSFEMMDGREWILDNVEDSETPGPQD